MLINNFELKTKAFPDSRGWAMLKSDYKTMN